MKLKTSERGEVHEGYMEDIWASRASQQRGWIGTQPQRVRVPPWNTRALAIRESDWVCVAYWDLRPTMGGDYRIVRVEIVMIDL